MRNLLLNTAVAGLLAVTVVGCGQSLDAARAEAASHVAEMLYLEDPDAVQAELRDATTVEEIRKLVAAAAQNDRERGDVYWECVDQASRSLPGSAWDTQAWHVDGSWDDVSLTLSDGGGAVLERRGSHPPAAQSMRPPTQMDTWLVENAESVTGWGSDLADRVASRSVLDGKPPMFSPINKSCWVQFVLTLSTPEEESTFTARLNYSPRTDGTLSLIVDGKTLSEKVE